jgi:hypothetical protein
MKDLSSQSWELIHASLSHKGYAHLPLLLDRAECDALAGLYPRTELYRNVIKMERYRFGKGEYKYFQYPLPGLIHSLRTQFYYHLAPLANEWMLRLGIPITYPASHSDFLAHCHEQQQVRPTPLILKYGKGGFNTLHQDLYGEIYFPFQVVIALTQEGRDHEGGESVFVEQIPRAQSRAEVVRPNQGDAILFTTNFRPAQGMRGYYRAHVKHGISEVRSGERYAMGIIFHDAA